MSTVEALLKEFRSGTRKVADYVEEILRTPKVTLIWGQLFH
ncbi:MAG: hypothetical protein CM15mP21_2850 [Hyphomicrobiales bacterium]|nr:MAG: hypothetical protein CM15mP21_2850 [Hyphomicrobiales bacterium]